MGTRVVLGMLLGARKAWVEAKYPTPGRGAPAEAVLPPGLGSWVSGLKLQRAESRRVCARTAGRPPDPKLQLSKAL